MGQAANACLRVIDVSSEGHPVDHIAFQISLFLFTAWGQEKPCLGTVVKSQGVFIWDTLIINTGTLEALQLFVERVSK